MNIQELKKAIKNNVPLVWNDPDPIDGNDYTITSIEDLEANCLDELEDDEWDCQPISIVYNEGSEAEVYLHEILVKEK